MEPADKRRRRVELFTAPMGGAPRTPEELRESFDDAVKSHPFVDLSEHVVELNQDGVFYDAEGNLCGALIRNAIPEHAAASAADVLRAAATRTSLRATIFGGEAPMSGIAGYYDYHGSPIEYKCRKTSFTCEAIREWPSVFPMVEYVSEVYKAAAPKEWEAQNRAIPDNVRINQSPFSTLTINQRFRTASHTDAGDFDAGFGCLAVLEGDYEGLHLGFPSFKVCFTMRPRDVLLFNTHHLHANTELERLDGQASDWTRLSCVFYYRVFLGDKYCLQHYKRRWETEKKLPLGKRAVSTLPASMAWVDTHDNGENNNRPAVVHPVFLTPFLPMLAKMSQTSKERLDAWLRLHGLCRLSLHRTRQCRQKLFKHIPKGGKGALFKKGTVSVALDETAAATTHLERPTDSAAMNESDTASAPSTAPSTPTATTTTANPSATLDPIAMLLFGEESFERLQDGLPERLPDDKEVATFLQVMPGKTSALGGFSEATGAMDTAVKNKSSLDEANLKLFLSPELLEMWKEARSGWLAMVVRDWRAMVSRNPDRDDFSWKNHSDMNTGFFELCDVAQQVMLTILEKEVATKQEENAFWLAFAGHLHHACAEELDMHPDAMSMKKLNVKLKDYNFGGTRYFKDMPPEEQERRMQRKKRIEQARRLGINAASRGGGMNGTEWMENDRYDYQSESAVVPYVTNGWATPQDNAKRTLLGVTEFSKLPQRLGFQKSLTEVNEKKELPSSRPPFWGDVPVGVIVVSPDGGPATARQVEREGPAPLPTQGPRSDDTFLLQQEIDRLLKNPAALRSQRTDVNMNVLPEYGSLLQAQGVAVQSMLASELRQFPITSINKDSQADVVVLRYVCSYATDVEVAQLVEAARRLLKPGGALLIADTVLSCRSLYLLKPTLRDVYNAVAGPCFQRLLCSWVPALRGTVGAVWTPSHLRTRSEWQTLLGTMGGCGAYFYFEGSPRNTAVLVLDA